MRSYLVLTPPGGPERDHRTTVILPDGFSWTALLFPWIWLLWNRLWLAAAAALVLQIASGFLMTFPQFEIAGLLLGFGVSLLVAMEGRNYRSEALQRRGWRLEDAIHARDLDTAEEIYFTGLPEPEKKPMPSSADWARQAAPTATTGSGLMGLFEHNPYERGTR